MARHRVASRSGIDHGLQRPQVLLQRLAAGRRERIPGDRLAFDEVAAQGEVTTVLQASQLRAEVAVGELQLLLERRETSPKPR